jgi:hydrogenase-4 membrane subunit HyfE
VVIAALMNIHTELWLELGILGDIFAWMLIGGTFVSIVSKHFGTTDVSRMKELAE